MIATKIQLAVKAYRKMVKPQLAGSSIVGDLVIDIDTRPLVSELVASGAVLDDAYDEKADGDLIEAFEINVPRGKSGFFAQTWDDLLLHHDFMVQEPDEYFIAEDDYLSSENKKNFTALRYNDTRALAQLVQDSADFIDKSDLGLKCILLLPAKLEIPIQYEAKDLRSTPGLLELSEEFGNAATKHKDQRKMILKVALNEMLSTLQPKVRFPVLLSRFHDFRQRVRDGYDLYVAEFSFEKILEEVNSHKLDYTIKLNKVFSDIQNQLLAVPAALILIGGQLKDEKVFAWHNIVIMLGCLIFVIFMDLLVRNQYNTLNAVHQEILEQEKHLVHRHFALYERFDKPYGELEKRYKHQKYLIRIVDLLVGLTFLTGSSLFFWYSTKPDYWLKVAILNWF
jgi:hypothetical protein